jgi:hypothetical protein
MRRRAACGLIALVCLLAGTLPAVAESPNSLGLKATYDVSATLNWAAGTLAVSSTALVTNDTDEPIGALTFNVLPAKIGQMVLEEVVVAKVPATAQVTGQTVSVTLPVPLGPAEQAAVRIRYSSRFGTTSTDKQWLFAKRNGIATAYRWIPWLSRAVKFKRPNFGEPFITANSDEVRVTITSDRQLLFAVTGRRVAVNGLTQTFVAHNVRDFNFAASPSYRVSRSTQGDTEVLVFYRSLPPATLMSAARNALQRFKSRVGPYPWAYFMVAESHSGLGMESPGMIWIPVTTARSNLVYLTTHETAHQWFYAAVGSDQADQPFADEALAEFLTRDLLGSNRTSGCSQQMLDRTIYEYSAGCYYEVVYIQGMNYIKGYRARVGEEAFWAGMRAYYADQMFRIGGTRKFLDTLDAFAPPGTGGGHESRFSRIYPL